MPRFLLFFYVIVYLTFWLSLSVPSELLGDCYNAILYSLLRYISVVINMIHLSFVDKNACGIDNISMR